MLPTDDPIYALRMKKTQFVSTFLNCLPTVYFYADITTAD